MSYGYCPVCGAEGISRERRVNGNDRCQNGHVYPSISACRRQGDSPLAQGEPCSHPGCQNHYLQPCEGCGRIRAMDLPIYGKHSARQLDEMGGYFQLHMSHMTLESLYGKGAIAVELGHRDMLIDKLTRERDALLEALEPSADTKQAYMGEFEIRYTQVDEDSNEHSAKMHVPWTSIKDIMKAIRERAQGDNRRKNDK